MTEEQIADLLAAEKRSGLVGGIVLSPPGVLDRADAVAWGREIGRVPSQFSDQEIQELCARISTQSSPRPLWPAYPQEAKHA